MLVLAKEPWGHPFSPTVLPGFGIASGSIDEPLALFCRLKRTGVAVKESLHVGMTSGLAESTEGEKCYLCHGCLLDGLASWHVRLEMVQRIALPRCKRPALRGFACVPKEV